MSKNFKEFQRKVENRKFAVENSWRGSGDGPYERAGKSSEGQRLWEMLSENLEAADACKVFDGYLPLESHRKILGRWLIILKRAMRKLLKIFWGWYIFPQYQRMSYFHGKVVNALCLERDILSNAVQQNQRLAEKVQQQSRQIEIQMGESYTRLHKNFCAQFDQAQERIEKLQQQLERLAQENLELRKKLEKLENLPTNDEEFYHCFEETFRGPQDLIRNRQRVYVPVIKQYITDWSKAKFIDVGSGRGEWLDILRENGAVDYVGVDLNTRQNALCAERGHRVIEMDCNTYLISLPENSVDMISGFQIIEHLCMSDLMELLRQSYRVLKSGGVILFETQNPRNLIVGADTFYIDPSHKRPLEPRLMEFLAEWCGYKQVQCIDANAWPNWEGVTEKNVDPKLQEVIRQFNDVNYRLFGPQDYAILAVKE